jgi:peptidoglycan/LPS O-acetylase OafA/YrhL
MKKRNINIDWLKTICMLMVIYIHAVPREVQMLLGRPLYLPHAVPIFMILFGYNRGKSVERRELEEIDELYDSPFLLKQLKSIMIPYTFLWVMIELPYWRAIGGVDARELILSFLEGGRGPGGYFIVLMIQAILLFPLLYWVMEKIGDIRSLVLVFILNIGIEFLSIPMNPDLYRLFISRHIFAIALGVYLAKNEEKINIKHWLPLASISLFYVITVEYGGAHYFIEHMWESQHPPAYFWTFVLAFIGMKLPIKGNAWITTIGKSSLHIFLVQKIYFMFRNQHFENMHSAVDLILSMILCVSLGVAFYMLENKYHKLRKNKKLRKTT